MSRAVSAGGTVDLPSVWPDLPGLRFRSLQRGPGATQAGRVPAKGLYLLVPDIWRPGAETTLWGCDIWHASASRSSRSSSRKDSVRTATPRHPARWRSESPCCAPSAGSIPADSPGEPPPTSSSSTFRRSTCSPVPPPPAPSSKTAPSSHHCAPAGTKRSDSSRRRWRECWRTG